MRTFLFSIAVLCGATAGASAEVKTKKVEYKFDGVTFIGHLAWDDSSKEQRPGVLVVHEWWGLDNYARMRAEQLAKMGYVAFACDMYGDGKSVEASKEHAKDAGEMATTVRKNIDVWRGRAKAALKVLTDFEFTDKSRCAAMGYCFGGGAVLELARSGAQVRGVVSFHGNLDTPNPDDAKNIKAKVLVLHGADDPFVPMAQVTAFMDEMRKAGVDWQMIVYGGAVHSFTNPASGNDPKAGAAYNEAADRRSWEAMRLFFAELFAR
jgi:dienelactone hydrolase